MPLPEAPDGTPLGFKRLVEVILLSAIVGTVVGVIGESAFGGWKLLELRWGWVLFAVGICFCIWLAFKSLGLGPHLDTSKVTRSTIPAWRHPAIWSFCAVLRLHGAWTSATPHKRIVV